MPEYKHLPAQFNERIEGFAFEIVAIFSGILTVVFMDWSWWTSSLFVFGLFYLVTLLPMWRWPASSLGKRMAGTHIVDVSNRPISLQRAHLRECVKWGLIFSTVGLYALIAFVMFSRRMDRRTPHDFLFKTKVVFRQSRLY
ncbi:MAG: RDD family protein [Acholeplasmatales bacterium]|nr:MAG: RDD family protein [Acholeplasmatales bacterium]